MKTNFLLAVSVLLTLGVCGESALRLVVKILEFLGLVGVVASKSAVTVSLFSGLTSLVPVLAHNVACDSRVVVFVILHGAIWLVKACLFAAVFNGYGK